MRRGTGHSAAAALLAAFTAAGTAACAGPPSKGDVHSVTLNQSRNNVLILAREPDSKMQPTQLVNSFLGALTGDQKDPTFGVAQEYLTPSARAKWNPAVTAATRIVNGPSSRWTRAPTPASTRPTPVRGAARPPPRGRPRRAADGHRDRPPRSPR